MKPFRPSVSLIGAFTGDRSADRYPVRVIRDEWVVPGDTGAAGDGSEKTVASGSGLAFVFGTAVTATLKHRDQGQVDGELENLVPTGGELNVLF